VKAFIVYAHPEPASFNAAMLDTAVRTLEECGHEVVVTDLYADGPRAFSGRGDFIGHADPERFNYPTEQKRAHQEGGFVADLAREQQRLLWCDLLILQFPLWWFGPPAILKAWIDRVFAFGFAYDLAHRFDRGKLLGRRGMLSLTTGGTTARFSDDGAYGDIERVLYPLHRGVLQYIGLDVVDPFIAYAAPRVTHQERRAMLAAYADRLRTVQYAPTRPMPSAGEAIREIIAET
jgi:NAD(P)H dehydrogenase (quinone)